ncbi:MAG: isoprenylcysteine carboxylmethyltransferase family protein [Candidatus Omnitrophica bacterium]|nr:isoprenylcysteine carboxylmethyltransferase family protein [Candidatus Omnitrophota bacterium]
MRKEKVKSRLYEKILILCGIIHVAGFLYLYSGSALGLWGLKAPPPTSAFLLKYIGPKGMFFLNVFIFCLLFPFLLYRKRPEHTRIRSWKSKGMLTAFWISLFTEMFGFALGMYMFSPFFQYPDFRRFIVHQELIIRWVLLLGRIPVAFGIFLIIAAWRKIYKGEGLVTDGIYRFIRHPQYVGISLILVGWCISWPTFPTLLLLPILLFTYWRLALQEEKELLGEYPQAYADYMSRVPRFIPGRLKSKKRV